MATLYTGTLIIGGGITGLAAASFLQDDPYLLVEREPECGGYCRTTIRNGFVWDYSGHFFHFRHPEIKAYLLEKMGCEVLTIEKISDIDYRGVIVDFPFQYNIDQLEKSDFIDCLIGLHQAKLTEPAHFKDYVQTSMGAGIAERFLIPYNEKLYATDLAELDVDAMRRFFPQPIRFEQMMERLVRKQTYASYNDHFIYPVGGSIEFVRSLMRRVPSENILAGAPIIALDLERKVAETRNHTIHFRHLVSTLPFHQLMRLTGGATDRLTSNKVAVFNLGFDRPTAIQTHWRYFPGPEVFYRVGFYNNLLQSSRMSLYVEIGARSEAVLEERELLSRVLRDLRAVGIIEDHRLIDHEFLVMDPAYVHINKDSDAQYQRWCDQHNPNGLYSIGRYGSWTYCSIEDNIVQARACAERLQQNP